jgi:hypothetical protein
MKQPADIVHVVLFAVVALCGTALVITHQIPAATLIMGLSAWAAPSAGASIARLTGFLPPPPPVDGPGPSAGAELPPTRVPVGPPGPPFPPSAASRSRLPWVGALAAVAACAGHITPADSATIAAQTEEEAQCVESNKPDKSAIDRCRANVRARSDAYWAAHFDGGGQ